MKDDCSLCNKGSFKFYITFCKSHPEAVLIVSTEHKANFSEEEKYMISKMFINRKIRFEQKSIKDHAHCHIE